jgi:hypothetical protein
MADHTIHVTELLEYLLEHRSMYDLASEVVTCFKAWFEDEKAQSCNQEDYLNRLKARGKLRSIESACKRSEAKGGECRVTVKQLAEFIRAAGMPVWALFSKRNEAPIPFDKLTPGKIVYICVAKRMALNKEGESPRAGWERPVYGARDVQSLVDLVDVLGQRMRVDFQLKLIPIEPTPEDDKAGLKTAMMEMEKELARLMHSRGTGAIVSLGSGPHNMMSNAMAKRIFDNSRKDLPVYFRWAVDNRKKVDFLDDTGVFGSDLTKCTAGLWYLYDGQWRFLQRTNDEAIVKVFKGRQKQRRYFFDCGMLAIDTRKRVPLVLACGHGGNATRACVQAIVRRDLIAREMGKLREGRFIGTLLAAREKCTPEPTVDDLTLPKGGRPWYLVKLETPSSRFPFPKPELGPQV